MRWLTRLLVLMGLGSLGYAQTLAPITDALWRGKIHLEVTGPQYVQSLANDQGNAGQPRFIKEKGEMQVNLVLDIEFTVNALGEYELLATESFQGKYLVERQIRYQIKEDRLMNKVNYVQTVQIAEEKSSTVTYNTQKTYDRESFQNGGFRLLPTGRLDKKGSLQLILDLPLRYEGKGSYVETHDSQPESKSYKKTRLEGDLEKAYELPLAFDLTIPLEGKPHSGSVPLVCDVKNPFVQSDENVKPIYRNNLKATGTFEMTPLFDKKKKKD